jgi:5'-nucleotidase
MQSLDQQESLASWPQEPIAPHLRVFVNRNLRMDTVKAVGFDMDYTLARYRRQRLEKLAHRLTLEKLVERGYTKKILHFEYDSSFVVRGLMVDKQTGNILKLDRHNHAGRVYHGRRLLDKRTRRKIYRREKIDFTPPRFALVDTLFSLPEMCIYADLVDYYTRHKLRLDPWKLFDDTRECIDECHRDGSLKRIVMQDVAKFVEKDPLLARTLHKLRSSGKKLFLLTNSYWPYSDCLMSYLLDNELAEYPSWQNYFEQIIVGASKPRFFNNREPLAEIDPVTNEVVARPAKRIQRGKIYQGGSLHDVETSLKVHGEEILYVGDHIYGDILRSKKASLWRSCLVVEELEDEITHLGQHREDFVKLGQLEEKRRELDSRTNILRRSLAGLKTKASQDTKNYRDLKKQRDKAKAELQKVVREMNAIQQNVSGSFNPSWGMVFKEDHENSRFGQQVAHYACIYTSRVTNLFHYSAYQYFRSPRDVMPHECAL